MLWLTKVVLFSLSIDQIPSCRFSMRRRYFFSLSTSASSARLRPVVSHETDTPVAFAGASAGLPDFADNDAGAPFFKERFASPFLFLIGSFLSANANLRTISASGVKPLNILDAF